jgi:hypothetical protein
MITDNDWKAKPACRGGKKGEAWISEISMRNASRLGSIMAWEERKGARHHYPISLCQRKQGKTSHEIIAKWHTPIHHPAQPTVVGPREKITTVSI